MTTVGLVFSGEVLMILSAAVPGPAFACPLARGGGCVTPFGFGGPIVVVSDFVDDTVWPDATRERMPLFGAMTFTVLGCDGGEARTGGRGNGLEDLR